MYKITQYSKNQAKKLGLTINPSKNKSKKIDVYRSLEKIASIGAIGYKDYPTYLAEEKKGKWPKGYANKRRKLYKTRHNNTRKIRWSNSWLADKILW
jgi:hypothetical protein